MGRRVLALLMICLLVASVYVDAKKHKKDKEKRKEKKALNEQTIVPFVDLVAGASIVRPDVSNFVLFIEGFAIGLEIDIGNASQCASDEKYTVDDFEDAWKDLDYGFTHASISYIEQGLREFGNGTQEIAQALKDCGVGTLADEIENIAKQLQEGPLGLVKVLIKEAVDIWHNRHNLTAEFKGFISSMREKDYRTAGINAGEIIGILLEN
eukprot:TRINITY_DN4811_c0_g1_i1.p1 TRINITY_DN4811_c0_g1~~TRINITY_DN4811_c0_g1_i1.p1  ORF type:complete len:210 (-),score=53.88 TRINITY_DN4811_c0_g1_i1:107-736(-)